MLTDSVTRRHRTGLRGIARTLWWIAPALLLGCWLLLGARTPAQAVKPATIEVGLADVDHVVTAVGKVQPRRKVDVAAQVSGTISGVHVVLGQWVQRGEPLVSLDAELATAELEQARAALAQQEAALESRRVDLALALREAGRQRRLHAGDAASASDVERAEAEHEKLAIDVRAHEAQRKRLQADAAKAQLRRGFTRIVAPADGYVVNLVAQVGQTLNAQQQAPVLLTLAELDRVTIVAQVPEAYLPMVRIGQPASFKLLTDDTTRHSATTRMIHPLPERVNNAVLYSVLLDVDNPPRRTGDGAARPAPLLTDRLLMPEMTVQVALQVAQVRQVPSIPIVALGERGADGRYAVRVLDAAGHESVRMVLLGLADVRHAQVLDGLRTGERVIVAAAGVTPNP